MSGKSRSAIEQPQPDLSHLTEDERKIIENVLQRQKEEEKKDVEIVKRKQEEIQTLELTIKKRAADQKKMGLTLEATCELCLKTRFADGVGHVCYYCGVRCCACCGGRVTLRSNKVIWVCILCRKKQELFTKAGQWVHGNLSDPLYRPILEKSHSTDSESVPLDRSKSLHPGGEQSLPGSRRGSLERSESSKSRESRKQNIVQRKSREGVRRTADLTSHDKERSHSYRRSPPNSDRQRRRSCSEPRGESTGEEHFPRDIERGHHIQGDGAWSRDCLPSPPRRENTELHETGSERTREASKHDRHRETREIRHEDFQFCDPVTRDEYRARGESSRDSSAERLSQRIRENEVKQHTDRGRATYCTPTCGRETSRRDSRYKSRGNSENQRDIKGKDIREVFRDLCIPYQDHLNDAVIICSCNAESQHHSPEDETEKGISGFNTDTRGHSSCCSRRKDVRSDLIVSEHVRTRLHKHRRSKKQRHRSPSSSDEDVTTISDWTNCDEEGLGRSSLEKGVRSHSRYKTQHSELQQTSRKNNTKQREPSCYYNDQDIYNEADLKKTVCFNCENVTSRQNCEELWDEQQMKDSGIDTGSSATLNEDNNKHSVGWKLSPDGTRMIGHVILKKSVKKGESGASTAAVLGLKVVGGRCLESGQLGALVEKVKMGSVADTVGHLQPGDEVLEWSSHSLQNRTYEEVFEIIADSREDHQVELTVSRPVRDIEWTEKLLCIDKGNKDFITSEDVSKHNIQQDWWPSVMVTSPGSPETVRVQPHSPVIGSRLQLKLSYNPQALQLIVTIICAAELATRRGKLMPNPYAKVFLLPDKSEKSKRRTKTLSNTNEPRWNQTFVYSPLRQLDLKTRALEISVWDYDCYVANDFLGEVLIDLSLITVDNRGHWYSLVRHEDSVNVQMKEQAIFLDTDTGSSTLADHLSPLSNVSSHLSDGDTSDFDDGTVVGAYLLTEKRTSVGGLDRISLSSLGSSSSPPVAGEEFNDVVERWVMKDLSPLEREQSETGEEPRYNQEGDKFFKVEDFINSTRREHPSQRGVEYTSRSLSPPVRSNSEVAPRYQPHSVGGTPTGILSPKKRQLPPTPSMYQRNNNLTIDLEDVPPLHLRQIIQLIRRPGGRYSDGDMTPSRSYEKQLHAHPYRGSQWLMGNGTGSDKRNSYPGKVVTLEREKMKSNEPETSLTSRLSVNTTDHSKGSRTLGEFTSKMHSCGPVHPPWPRKSGLFEENMSFDSRNDEKHDGSLSDTAVGSITEGGQILKQTSRRRGMKGEKAIQFVGLSQKSSSTSQLSVTEETGRSHNGCIKRSLVLHTKSPLSKETSRSSMNSRANSLSNEKSLKMPTLRLTLEGEYSTFVEGLGPGQFVGRQGLASPYLGDIQLSIYDRRRNLEVEVIRARGLQPKPGAKSLPASYVKIYLVLGSKCLSKAKTSTARRTLDPLFQEQLHFDEDYRGCVLQVTIWGDYGRLEKKVLMGVAQIMLDELDLSDIVIRWYKLFHPASLVNLPGNSQSSIDKFG
ncbi:regulating synaptic membrane exocytosis protein 2-like isoform X3 [Tachypleus tridentatus]|uniref:regulating synaptic membrane exocytosis protein 2-like isoform X3 n=1 Tax=Tachypleus tridentatus TaxID=6853 RepID=UPI003FCFD649